MNVKIHGVLDVIRNEKWLKGEFTPQEIMGEIIGHFDLDGGVDHRRH